MQATKEVIFEYLDELRESGEINMFGAAIYIQQKFAATRTESIQILTEWINRQ